MKLILLNIVVLLMASHDLYSQEAVLSSGGDATGSGGSVSYSIGQVIYTTNFGASTSSAQGVQQPYEISIVSEVIENESNLEILVYPNPTTDFLILKIENFDLANLSYELYSIEGKLIDHSIINNNTNSIKVDGLPNSTYFLKVIENQKPVKTFKIIKN